jgi:hypothetical protein
VVAAVGKAAAGLFKCTVVHLRRKKRPDLGIALIGI